jgi:biopolymer transport protein ExbD
MQKKQIIVTIDEKGKTSLEVKGVKGNHCVELTDDLLKSLGPVVHQTKKPEFYQSVVAATDKVRSQ